MGRYESYKEGNAVSGGRYAQYRQQQPTPKPVVLNKAVQSATTPSSRGASQALGTSSLRNLVLEKEPPKKQGFISKGIEGAKSVAKGETSIMDVVKSVPSGISTVAKGLTAIPKAVFPAITEGVYTPGKIIGEGLAYATNKEVRKQYESGRTDVLPTIDKTTQKDVAKKVIAAGLEATLFKYFPQGIKQMVMARGGLGAIEGLGYAITEGMAKDETVDEIIQKLPTYMTTGALANVIAPHLGKILTAELGSAPKEVKDMFKKLYDEVKPPKVGDTVTPPKETPKVTEKEATSAVSFVDNKGGKYHTDLTEKELNNLIEENKRIPEAERGASQIHLDAKTGAQIENSTYLSRKEFIERHPQAKKVIDNAEKGTELNINEMYILDGEQTKITSIKGDTVKYMTPTQKGSMKKEEFYNRTTKFDNADGDEFINKTKTTQTTKTVQGVEMSGSGETKASAFAKRLSAVDDPNVPTYNTSNQKAHIARGEQYYKDKSVDELMDVLEGKVDKPKQLSNIETNALLPTMLSRLDEMTPTQLLRASKIKDIRSLTATQAGKENSILQQIDPENPLNSIAEVTRVREEMAVKRAKADSAKTMKKSEMSKIEKLEMTKQNKINALKEALKEVNIC